MPNPALPQANIDSTILFLIFISIATASRKIFATAGRTHFLLKALIQEVTAGFFPIFYTPLHLSFLASHQSRLRKTHSNILGITARQRTTMAFLLLRVIYWFKYGQEI